MLTSLDQIHLKDYLVSDIVIVTPDSPVVDVYQKMQRSQVRHIPVVEKGEPVGIISDRDVKFVSYSTGVTELTAKDIMTPGPYSPAVGTHMKEVLTTMSKKKIGSALVVDEQKKIAGIFTLTDALEILAKAFPSDEDE